MLEKKSFFLFSVEGVVFKLDKEGKVVKKYKIKYKYKNKEKG